MVHRENALYPLEVYNFLKEIGSGFIQFIPIVERERVETEERTILCWSRPDVREAMVTDWSVLPEEYGEFLITIFDEWVRKDVGRVFVQIFDVTLANWVGQPPGLCVFNETCGNAMVLEHNGDSVLLRPFCLPEVQAGKYH